MKAQNANLSLHQNFVCFGMFGSWPFPSLFFFRFGWLQCACFSRNWFNEFWTYWMFFSISIVSQRYLPHRWDLFSVTRFWHQVITFWVSPVWMKYPLGMTRWHLDWYSPWSWSLCPWQLLSSSGLKKLLDCSSLWSPTSSLSSPKSRFIEKE